VGRQIPRANRHAWGYNRDEESVIVYSEFEELNAYVYHSVRGAVLDVLIWCLGPYVDDTREYGLLRAYLAQVTRSILRRWYTVNAD
jgi:hypothetical protein